MAIGAGKYDPEATAARESTGAKAVVLVVLEGALGSGLSVQALPGTFGSSLDMARALATAMRDAADKIERDVTS